MAIHWRHPGGEDAVPFSLAEAGESYVAVRWDDCVVIGAYISPRLNVQEFEERLDRIGECIDRFAPTPTILAGDFNAKAALWGSPITNAKGTAMEDWAGVIGLCCMNSGNQSTCIRAQGESVIDTTWATPVAGRRISQWTVRAEMETLSDHAYITWDVALSRKASNESRSRDVDDTNARKRWTLAKLDRDKFVAALLASSWPAEDGELRQLKEEVSRLREEIRDACDVSMPRSVPGPRTAVYWWSEQIAEARCAAIARRRVWKQNRGMPDEVNLREEYSQAKYRLCHAINVAKKSSWDELLGTLDQEPWGRPYKIVRKKLKRWSLPIMEALESDFLGTVTDTLFPRSVEEEARDREDRVLDDGDDEWSEDLAISEMELTAAIRKMSARNAAPGPDNVHGKLVALAYGVIGSKIRRILTRCLREGIFPSLWK